MEPNDQVLEQQEESEQPENNGSITIPPYRGLYTSKYFYLEYATGEIELYNLINDPYQLNNIASTAALSFIDHFSKWLANLSKCKGSECYIADQLQ